jgi:hypothetical protein
MPVTFTYVRPDENWALYGAVSTTAGATDTTYVDEWICDGRAGRPVRATSGTATWSITNPSGEVGLVAVCNCTASVSATIGGSVSGTVAAGALQPDGVRLNGFTTVTPAATTTLTVGFSGAASAVIVGEVIAGRARTLTRPLYGGDESAYERFSREVELDLASIPPYDSGLVGRTWKGQFLVNSATLDDIKGWYQAQRNRTRPSLIVPDPSVNDAWVCFLSEPNWRPVSGTLWAVSLSFTEVPRTRW